MRQAQRLADLPFSFTATNTENFLYGSHPINCFMVQCLLRWDFTQSTAAALSYIIIIGILELFHEGGRLMIDMGVEKCRRSSHTEKTASPRRGTGVEFAEEARGAVTAMIKHWRTFGTSPAGGRACTL